VLIGGFIITGNSPKKIIARALGPSLPLAGSLADPRIQIFNSNNDLVAENDDWRQARNFQAIERTHIAARSKFEAVVLRTIAPGAYTAVVSGVNGGTGVGSIEIYDLDSNADSQLSNISTRGIVETGDDVMIGGFILVGAEPRKVIIRALGPSLPVPGRLADPVLQLFDGNGNLLATNDNWSSNKRAIIATGLPPSNELEAAIATRLQAGAYTAIVRDAHGETGVALVEVYALE
jgi:hypothetical protein